MIYLSFDQENEASHLVNIDWWIGEAFLIVEQEEINPYDIKNISVRVSSINSVVYDHMRVRQILETSDYVSLPSFPKAVLMKLLIWNCKGAGNKAFNCTMKELEKNHKPSIIVLMETKVELSSMGSFFNNLGFTASSHVDPVGRSGGI
ncbi:hypothetical protein LOK49_LG03G00982 [Camellia lanceoleosa]|uniref:Uncharacterized protein n=1 Tax=Camellia lanceoleosa TaxID=1840588 RepID=A0ACC0I9H8_9ERIC|nr:hypothetical protein LOK49_LG03G00982 [Camellia lanceoleosa]